MNFRRVRTQTDVSAPGGRHRYSEALPGHDVAAVAWAAPGCATTVRQRERRSAESAVFLAGPRLTEARTCQGTHARQHALPDLCQQRQELLGHSTFAVCFAARKRL